MNNLEKNAVNLHLISDFNLDILGQYLKNEDSANLLSVTAAPFGQLVPALLQPPPAGTSSFAVIWTSPEKAVPSFAEALNFHPVDEARLLAEVRQFAGCLKQAQTNFAAIFVVSWTLPSTRRGTGLLELKGQGARKLLQKMNLALIEELGNCAAVYVLDGQRWMELVGKNAYSPKMWYLTKTPFHSDVFRWAAHDLKAAIAALHGGSRKLVIVDLDNTLWGGVVGDLGWENLRLGGHDYLGEAFVDFQKALQSLSRRGILLAIVSKNEESIALEALNRHAEMVLRPRDFAAWRINWNDKAANVAELVAELNLGLQSAVFIDDNPVERARLREALPEVLVPEWPEDKTLYATRLLEMDCFDSAYATAEDELRNQMYASEKQRELLKQTVSSAEEWLLSLDTEVMIEELNPANRVRVVQLLNKTNQMNLSTRRLSEQALQSWLQSGNRKLWAFRVKDKFGDSGLTGILSLEWQGAVATIQDFVLSCRVMGRHVENAMLAFAAEHAAASGCRELQAQYVPTAKNKPCLQFWLASGFSCNEKENSFNWSLNQTYPFPNGIKVQSPLAVRVEADGSHKQNARHPEGTSLPVFTD